MEMHQVRYFLALCEEQSFTRAAKRCGVSQPSLTNAIKRLEAELGGSLFRRNRTNTRLTDLGIIVRPDLVQIDRSTAEAKRKAEKFSAVPSVSHQPRSNGGVHACISRYRCRRSSRYWVRSEAVFVPAKASRRRIYTPVADTVMMDVRALEATIDIKSLPEQNIVSEADPDPDADKAPAK